MYRLAPVPILSFAAGQIWQNVAGNCPTWIIVLSLAVTLTLMALSYAHSPDNI